MANFVYDKGREAFLSAAINMTSDTIRALLVNASAGHYVASQTTHQYLSDVSSGDRLAASNALSSITITAGVVNAASALFTSATPSIYGATAIILYKDTGSASTSPLICYIDSYVGLPIVIDGSDITLYWPTSANKIFRL